MSDDLTTVVAEAITKARSDGMALASIAARAAITAIAAQGDVTDEQIRDAASEVWDKEDAYEVTHALLVQATAPLHARIAELEAEVTDLAESRHRHMNWEGQAVGRAEAAEATVERQAADVDRVFASFDADLRRWQNEGGIRYSAFTDLRRQVAAALADQKEGAGHHRSTTTRPSGC